MDNQEVAKRVEQAMRSQLSDLVIRNTELAVRLEMAMAEVAKYKPVEDDKPKEPAE
jgi:hypothetical protein